MGKLVLILAAFCFQSCDKLEPSDSYCVEADVVEKRTGDKILNFTLFVETCNGKYRFQSNGKGRLEVKLGGGCETRTIIIGVDSRGFQSMSKTVEESGLWCTNQTFELEKF
jgi:hypothetical protein